MKALCCAMTSLLCLSCTVTSKEIANANANASIVDIDTRMDPPRWATLERQLLSANAPACREFFDKYFDIRGHL
jgi:hypothetical protein